MTTASLTAPRTSLARRLLQPLVSPEVFDFWAGLVRPGASWSRPLGRIVARHETARDAVTLLIQPNRHWGGFQPGQHLNVGAQVGGRWVQRSYSLSGIPRRDGRIAITVRRVEGGALSSHLTAHSRVGDVLTLGPAFGDMTWPEDRVTDAPGGAWLFLAAGSGITPLISLTRAWAAAGTPVDLTLVYWARTREELCFAEELRALALREGRFRVHFVLTRQEGLRDTELQGRLSEARLESIVPDLARRQIYACGPAGFVDTARRVAAPRARSFLAEAFTPPVLAPAGASAGTVAVHLTASGRTLQIAAGQSLLIALEEQGLRPASGCRMGICRTCVCPKAEGSTQNLTTGELHHGHDSALRLCVSRACSDLTLDL